MESGRIERQFSDEQDLHRYLMECDEITYASYVDDVYKKVLLLSAASYFETVISNAIISFVRNAASADSRVAVLVEKKALSRQYHTLFQWGQNNSNSFWALFGDETKKKVRKLIDSSEEMKQAEVDFLDVGNRRNLLVHENFSEYNVNITVEEIYKKYRSACKFIGLIQIVLKPTFLKSDMSLKGFEESS